VNPLAVHSVGMVTPAAGDAAGSIGLIYTESRQFGSLPRIAVGAPEPSGLRTPLGGELAGVDRLVALGARALWEAVDGDLAERELGLVVCAPSAEDETSLSSTGDELLGRLASQAQLRVARRGCRGFSSGRSAIFDALAFARTVLQQSDLPAICLLGVDSLVTRSRLKRSLEYGEAQCIPGEAAAAVVLSRKPVSGREPLLIGWGATNLSSTGVSSPVSGRALIGAIEQAVADAELSGPVFTQMVCDTSGAEPDMEELAWAKTGRPFARSTQMESYFPHFVTGDAGAAMGPLALATAAFLIGKSPSPAMALGCISSSRQRGAAILASSAGSA